MRKAELHRDLCYFEQDGLSSLMSDYDKEARQSGAGRPLLLLLPPPFFVFASEEVKAMRRLMERLDGKLQEAAPEPTEARRPDRAFLESESPRLAKVTLPSQADSAP